MSAPNVRRFRNKNDRRTVSRCFPFTFEDQPHYARDTTRLVSDWECGTALHRHSLSWRETVAVGDIARCQVLLRVRHNIVCACDEVATRHISYNVLYTSAES